MIRGSFAQMNAQRGLVPTYHKGRDNACPGCGRSHWILGLSSAECAFCATALPYASATTPAVPLELAA